MAIAPARVMIGGSWIYPFMTSYIPHDATAPGTLGRRGEAWAWWAFAISCATGFASFLCYLGYGYLDTWHGVATLALLPCFIFGMWKMRGLLGAQAGWRSLLAHAESGFATRRERLGRALLILVAFGKIGAGAVIMFVGMTSVFVRENTNAYAAAMFCLRSRNGSVAR